MVVESFGEQKTLDWMFELHKECDQYGARILKRFLEERKVKAMVQEIQRQRNKDTGCAKLDRKIEGTI